MTAILKKTTSTLKPLGHLGPDFICNVSEIKDFYFLWISVVRFDSVATTRFHWPVAWRKVVTHWLVELFHTYYLAAVAAIWKTWKISCLKLHGQFQSRIVASVYGIGEQGCVFSSSKIHRPWHGCTVCICMAYWIGNFEFSLNNFVTGWGSQDLCNGLVS